ncbi:MAG: MATE family efflux transporter [Eubacterium sp.]|nr:MATE family efflux transporter [Eubacterium sp.]
MKNIYKKLFIIVLPISFQYLMSALVSASDAFMLGFLDQDSLSAVSLATQIAFIYSLFFGAFVYGCSVLAAQYWGKGDKKTVDEVLAITMRYTLLVGLIFTLATLFVPKQIMHVFTSDPILISKGAGYLRMVSLSYIIGGFSQVYFGILKICDKAVLSSVIGSISVVLNIVLNACLIFGLGFFPEMGIGGAALATIIARVFEAAFVLVLIFMGKCPSLNIMKMLMINSVGQRLSKELHKDYWKYTVPLLLNQLGWGGGVAMYSVIMGHLGSDATAANSIASIVRGIVASFCWGIASGVSIILGQMMGRNELDEAKRAGGSFVRFSILIGFISGLILLAVTPLLMKVITFEGQARGYLKIMMFLSSYYIIGNSLNSTIIGGIFPAGGDTKFGMWCDIITLWGVVVPLGMLGAFVWKFSIPVVAFILTLDEFVKIPAVYIHYMKYKWVKNITKEVASE